MSAPTCSGCGVDLAPVPDHPGNELGDWYEHPGYRPGMFGHTASAVLPKAEPSTEQVRASLRGQPVCSMARVVDCGLTQPQCAGSLDARCVGHLIHECDEPARWRFTGGNTLQYACNNLDHKIAMMRAFPHTVMTPYVGTLAGARA